MNVIYDVTITQLDLEETVEIDFHVVLQKSDLIFDKVSRNWAFLRTILLLYLENIFCRNEHFSTSYFL